MFWPSSNLDPPCAYHSMSVQVEKGCSEPWQGLNESDKLELLAILARIVESSQNLSFDTSAVHAVMASAPAPSLLPD